MGHLITPLIYWNRQEDDPDFSVETADFKRLPADRAGLLAYETMDTMGRRSSAQREIARMGQEFTAFPRWRTVWQICMGVI